MRILHYKTTMRREEGGVVKAVLDLVSMGHTSDDIGLATTDPTGVPEAWRSGQTERIEVHELGDPTPGSLTLTAEQRARMREIIAGYDVVHLHSMWTPANPQVAKICAGLGKPYIVSTHGMLDDWCMSQRRLKKVLYLKTWGRQFLYQASAVLCTAQAELDQASRWFRPGKGVVIPLPIDLRAYQNLPDTELAYASFAGLDRAVPKVLFLSRIHYKKGLDRLIRASALLRRSGLEHQLVIAGTGETLYVEQMKQLAHEEGVGDIACFLGFVSGEQKVALFAACDVFALPTSQENFGFVFFEAIAAGTTVLTTRGTDTWPEINSSGGGVISDNTPEAFAEQLRGLLENPARTEQMGRQGREWVMREMNVDRVRERYRGMYTSCIYGERGME